MDTAAELIRTRNLTQEAIRYIPGGVNSHRRRVEPPFAAQKAKGAYLEDLDGRRFTDYHAAFGAILLGHSHPAVIDKVSGAIQEAVLFGVGTTEYEVDLARRIVLNFPSMEQIVLCNSGSEATYHAIRLARGSTGRDKIVKFQGCYHGFHDYVLGGSTEEDKAQEEGRTSRLKPEDGTNKEQRRGRGSAGVLPAANDSTLVCRYNDLEDVERTLRSNEDEVAAIILEPIAHNSATMMPNLGFLEGLRSICDREGIVLIFDEVITGFRHHIGGYQTMAGVTPDLTTVAKALGNGFSIAGVGGKREYMERFSSNPGGDIFIAGTYNGNTHGVAAALAVIEALEDGDVHEHIYRLGEKMRRGLREIVGRAGIAGTVCGFGSIFALLFMEGPLESYDDFLRNDDDLLVGYRRELVARGVFEMPDSVGVRSHITYSHTDDDVDRTLEIAEEALHAALNNQTGASVSRQA